MFCREQVAQLRDFTPQFAAKGLNLVVIGNAIRRDNVEARAAIDGGMKYVSFTDALAWVASLPVRAP